jgi:hypothetical protein
MRGARRGSPRQALRQAASDDGCVRRGVRARWSDRGMDDNGSLAAGAMAARDGSSQAHANQRAPARCAPPGATAPRRWALCPLKKRRLLERSTCAVVQPWCSPALFRGPSTHFWGRSQFAQLACRQRRPWPGRLRASGRERERERERGTRPAVTQRRHVRLRRRRDAPLAAGGVQDAAVRRCCGASRRAGRTGLATARPCTAGDVRRLM